MKQVVVSIFDAAAGVYSRPVFVQSRGVAMRSFSDEVNREAADNEVNKHPGDFSLHMLAEFDDETGCFIASGQPVRLVSASEVKV